MLKRSLSRDDSTTVKVTFALLLGTWFCDPVPDGYEANDFAAVNSILRV